jgi:hypothetical protein
MRGHDPDFRRSDHVPSFLKKRQAGILIILLPWREEVGRRGLLVHG